jgi:hypothetical protein
MRCTATQKADGTPLKPHWAIKGGTVCNHHGGGAPQVRAAANARLTEEKARKALHIWATDPKAVESADHPGDVLLEELARTVSVVRKLQLRITEEDPDALVWGVSSADAGTVADAHGGTVEVASIRKEAKPSVWLNLYGEERDRLLGICRVVAQLNLDERRVRLDERTGDMIAQVVRQSFIALGVDPEPLAVREVVEAQLMIAGSA